MSHKLRLVSLSLTLLTASHLAPGSLFATSSQSPAARARASSFRIDESGTPTGGRLYITVAGRERKIYNEAFNAWLVNDGRDVVFSSHDGAGGFENEGQSLRIYNVATRAVRKILSEIVGINAVQEVKTSTGKTVLLVAMSDGGLGGSYFAVVDPKRGEVFFRRWAEVTAINGDHVTLALFRADDFEAINDERGWKPGPSNQVISKTKVVPYKTETHDLKRLLRNRVIYNRRPNLTAPSKPLTSRTIKIYLWDANSNKADIALVPVTRRIGGDNVLKLTMDWLFGTTLSREEEDRGLSLPTFGMRLEGVTLKNGLALIKFSQPAGATNYGSQGPFIFAKAIERTARQFPTVKRVEICAVGETLIDSQLERPFPRCAK
ncbi:MAG TPA: GerMN domain-containing protein [Pyrinomonadaceae bacterium]